MKKMILVFKLRNAVRRGGYEMNGFAKMMLTIFLVCYIVSPVDAVPGPVDDLILLLVGLAARKGLSDGRY